MTYDTVPVDASSYSEKAAFLKQKFKIIGKSHERCTDLSYNPANLGIAPASGREAGDIGNRTRCFSNSLDADIRDALKEFAAEGVNNITIILLTFATGFWPSNPIPEDKMKKILKNTDLPKDAKIPEQKPLVIPENINVDDKDVPAKVERPYGLEPLNKMSNRIHALSP